MGKRGMRSGWSPADWSSVWRSGRRDGWGPPGRSGGRRGARGAVKESGDIRRRDGVYRQRCGREGRRRLKGSPEEEEDAEQPREQEGVRKQKDRSKTAGTPVSPL